jgi:hypothetical protein
MGRRRWCLFVAGVLAVFTILALEASQAFAGTLANVSWSVNNSQTGKTAVTYAFSFKTATAGTIKTVTMTVPAGTAGTVAVGTVYGLGAGTVALASNTITYTVTSAVAVAANIPIYLSFTGITNTSTAGSYTSTETTQTSVPATIDTGTSQSVTFGSSSTTATVTVAQTLAFTNDTPSFSLAVDPTGTANNSSQTVTLSIKTNAASGYTLAASDLGLSRTSPAYTIPAVSVGPGTGVGTFPASGWGASATLTASGGHGAAMASGLSGGQFVGYPASAATFLSATGPTGASADTFVLTDQVAVDYAVPAGSYTDTITYVATPSY